MSYVLKIGSADTCYIILGGITGLSLFNPTEVLGTATPVIINIDSKDQNDPFSPWIKQSMQVNLVKQSEDDFSDIINGVDDTTYGVYIEGGSLSLSSGNLAISSGGKLKFIGKFASETYSEDYKAITPVQFTFFDGIGKLEDEGNIFIPRNDRMSITEILADTLSETDIYKKLYLEWNFIFTTSDVTPVTFDNPKDFYLDVEKYFGRNKIELLEQMLHDNGLQLKVDFEANASGCLHERGAARIIQVDKHPDASYTYWEFNYSSGDYVYVQSVTGLRTPQRIASSELLTINANTKLQLQRKASKIVASVSYALDENIYPEGEISEDYFAVDSNGLAVYHPFGYISGADIYQTLKDTLNNGTLYGLNHPLTGYSGSTLGIRVDKSTTTKYALVLPPILYFKDYSWWKIKYSITAKRVGASSSDLKMHVSMLYKQAADTYTINSPVDDFTSQDQLDDLYDGPIDAEQTFTGSFSYGTAYPLRAMPVIVCTCSDSAYISISSIKFTIIASPYGYDNATISDLPSKFTLETDLSGINRKIVTLESEFCTYPTSDILINNFKYKNLLTVYRSRHVPWKIKYNDAYNYLIAHLSDMYGRQYDDNRYTVTSDCKATTSVNLSGQFLLDEKILMLMAGTYDAKRKILSGTFAQVLEDETKKNSLVRDDLIHFEWDDGELIYLG